MWRLNCAEIKIALLRYDTIEEYNVDSKAEYKLNLVYYHALLVITRFLKSSGLHLCTQ